MDYIERRAKRLEADYRHCLRYGITHEQPYPLLPTLWAAYGVNADTLVRC